VGSFVEITAGPKLSRKINVEASTRALQT